MSSAILAAVLAAAMLPSAGTFSVQPPASVLRFHVNHKLHHVQGESRTVEGKAIIGENGRVVCMVRAPVSSFNSGDGNRDAHMREVLEAGKFPFVVWKGVLQLEPGRPVPPAGVTMQGELQFHGVTQQAAVPITLEAAEDGSLRVRGRLEVNLDAHRIDRPSLLFVKIDETAGVDFELVLKAEGT
jgi:polyisoprenoid-binding protein YceI